MATTFTKIASYEVPSGGQASIDFTSIPSTYTDLVIKISGRINTGAYTDDILISFNGSTSSFTWRGLYYFGGGGVGSNTSTASPGNGQISGNSPGTTTTSNTFSNSEWYIPNYAGSAYKSISVDSVGENNATDNFMTLSTNLWANTAAINRVTFTPRSASFMQYSTATLYGVKNA